MWICQRGILAGKIFIEEKNSWREKKVCEVNFKRVGNFWEFSYLRLNRRYHLLLGLVQQ